MYSKFLVFVFLLFSESVFAQMQLKLTVEMPDCKDESFLLLRGDEGGVFVIDREEVSVEGILLFSWEGNYGAYRLSGDSGHIDFLISTPDFQFSLDGKPLDGELRFPDEDENNQYQYYLSEFQVLNQSMSSVRENLQSLNKKDSLYKDLHEEFKQLKKEKKILLRDLWGNHFDSWSVRMVLAQQELMPDLKMKGKAYDEYYQKHFFDYFAFSDSVLQATPVYYEKIGKYLKAHHLNELIQQENHKKTKEIIGNLFWLSELEPTSQKYLANYLMNRYPEQQYPKIYHTIADNYKVLNACEYVLANKTIQNRIRNSRKNKAGWIVPDIDLYNSMDGRIQSLSDVNSELTLLVVWSGSCNHSKDMLEKIREVYDFYHEMGLEVVAVSLDSNLNFWEQTVSQNYYPWINACDTDGLNGIVATQFNIYVTPSMFLIDPSLKNIAVPQTFFQLEQELVEFFQ